MRLLVCGGRDFNDKEYLAKVLNDLKITTLIHGDARGADSLAKEWALKKGNIELLPFPANWADLDAPGARVRTGPYGPYNVLAGLARNQKMLDEGKPDFVVAFPGGSGTADMITKAKRAGIPVEEI